MSDRRQHDVHRALKRAWQGQPQRDVLRRLHEQQKHATWPACRPAAPASPAPVQAPQHVTTEHEEP